MSFLTTRPEALNSAAGSLHGIGTAVSAANAASAAPTTGVIPAAADPVSALVAAQFRHTRRPIRRPVHRPPRFTGSW